MSHQNIQSDLLVELSTEEAELLSGGYYGRSRRRRGGQRQKNTQTQTLNIVFPGGRPPEDGGGSDPGSSDPGGGDPGGCGDDRGSSSGSEIR